MGNVWSCSSYFPQFIKKKKKNSFKMKGKAMIKKKNSRQYTPPHFYVSTFNYYSGTDGPL